MAIRINNAKDFAGRLYLTTAALESLFTNFALDGNTLALTMNVNGSNVVTSANLSTLVKDTNAEFITVTSNVIDDSKLGTFLGTASGSATASRIVTTGTTGNLEYTLQTTSAIASGSTAAVDTKIPTEKAVRDYVDNKAINVVAGNGVVIDSTTDPLAPVISTDIKIEKMANAETGYAASYQLKIKAADSAATGIDANGYIVAGETINIVKDQFLKEGALVYGTSATVNNDGTITGESATKTETAIYPFVKLVLYTNTNDSLADEQTATSTIYIPVNELFHDKTAGAGIDAIAMASNVVAVKIENATDALKVYTAKGTETDLIAATASGLVVANVQAAIDLAVEDEHAKMGAAVSAVEANVATLQGATATAVTALNTRIETVASNAATAANALEAEIVAVDGKVSAAINSVNGNLSAAVANVATSVNARTANAVQMLEENKSIAAINGGAAGEYGCSVNANSIIAVYDGNGIEIYPEITRTAATGTGSGAFDYALKADFGAKTPDSTWTVLYTLPLAAYPAVTAGTVTYTTTDSAAKTVENGTAATAPAAPSEFTVGGLSYKQNA